MLKEVNPRQNFPELENAILKFWQENGIFEKQVSSRPASDKYVFYDGPPFITGLPHYGHLLGSISKDIIPRYQAMRGKRVERVWGWDCHGLPIENKVEKALGLKNRRDIEKLGIDKFIAECYKYTREVSAEWNWYIDKVGRWVDMDYAYRTMDQDYMESVMWVFKELYDKSLVYEGVRTSLFCPRCGTPVSNFEIAMDNSYTDMEDPAVTIKFKLKNSNTPDTYLLAWTTTPWTLPSNRALVVDEAGDYVKVKIKSTMDKSRNGATAVIYDPKHDKFLFTVWEQDRVVGIRSLVQGGKENDETTEQTVLREVTEETGYTDLKLVKKLGTNKYQWKSKNKIYEKDYDVYLIELENGKKQKQKLEPGEKFELEWISSEEVMRKITYKSNHAFLEQALAHYNKLECKQKEIDFDDSPYSGDMEEYLILGKNRLEETLKDTEYEIVEEFKGSKLIGESYEPLYNYIPANDKDFKIYSYEGMVNADEGVGIVHSAPGFGEIDSEMGKHYGLTMMFTINDEGKFIPDVTDYAGMYYKDSNKFIIVNLVSRNLLFKNEVIVHRYPFCYRCETPLIQKAQKSWFIDVQKIKADLIKNGENINWVPDHIKEGRFKKGLETAPDWCISRTRFWGTPMPVWQEMDANGKVIERVVIGSREDLMNRSNEITKITFVRHGDADKQLDIDAALNEKGKEQAKALVEKLGNEKFDVILCSSMKRCRETIEPLANNLGIKVGVDERLGSLKRKEELYKIRDEVLKVKNLSDAGEAKAREALSNLIDQDAKTITDICEKYKGKRVLLCTHAEIIASMRHTLEGSDYTAELKRQPAKGGVFVTYLYNAQLLDLHRPVIDNIVIRGDKVEKLHRVKETLDVWMESASMPYAQKHYPFENKEDVESNFPADYISEYIAQTRAWFYVMHVISTALWNKNCFANVVVSGVIMGNDGRKMSKSFGNYPDPKGVIEKYGGDSLRLYLLRTPLLKGENVDIDEKRIKSQTQEFLLPLWNSYSFLVTYAHIHKWEPEKFDVTTVSHYLDKWIITRLKSFMMRIEDKLNKYDLPGASNDLPEFIDDLSRWYIRRSRDRFKIGDKEAMATLHYVISEFSKIIAPFTPFIADEIYRNLSGEIDNCESVHLCILPDEKELSDSIDKSVDEQMMIVRNISNIGQSLRVENSIKLRQPLAKAQITMPEAVDVEEWMVDILKDELNLKEIEFTKKHLSGDKYFKVSDQSTGVMLTLDANLTAELKAEGVVRETIRNIQALRKKSGLKFGEMIDMQISCEDDDTRMIIESNVEEVKEAVNAASLELTEQPIEGLDMNVEEIKMKIKMKID